MARYVPSQLTTERLLLRRWSLDEAPALRAAIDANDAHLRPWIPFMREEPRSMEATRAWLAQHMEHFEQGVHFRYALWRQGSGELLGEAMLLGRGGAGVLEVGYWLIAEACGEGLASEATRALVELAFSQPDVERIEIQCDVHNAPSNAIPRRLGAAQIRVDEVEDGKALNVWELRR